MGNEGGRVGGMVPSRRPSSSLKGGVQEEGQQGSELMTTGVQALATAFWTSVGDGENRSRYAFDHSGGSDYVPQTLCWCTNLIMIVCDVDKLFTVHVGG